MAGFREKYEGWEESKSMQAVIKQNKVHKIRGTL
jgi:hypothetical protein